MAFNQNSKHQVLRATPEHLRAPGPAQLPKQQGKLLKSLLQPQKHRQVSGSALPAYEQQYQKCTKEFSLERTTEQQHLQLICARSHYKQIL